VALRRRGLVTVGAAVACCALAGACTSRSAPATTSSPSPATTTSTETQIEREMRGDYQAAEVAYRASVAEHDRQAQLGTANAAALRKTSAGAYLHFSLSSLRRSRDAGWRAKGTTKIINVVGMGWQQQSIRLIACEDSSAVKFTDRRGKDVTPKVRRTYVQDLTATKDGDDWKVADISSTVVKSFEGQPCAA
jgi:hypothetical protein